MDISTLLKERDLQYAKTTIIDRAVPYIDGFKPVQRKIMYTMAELGLITGKTKKSARIVGDCMGKYHPHGDQSIYDALCKMEMEYDGFNAPLVKGQGSFGRAWSNPKLDGGIQAAKMRYTEAMLTPLAAELFDGIKEGAVKMLDNYDGTEKEPYVLPTKFPNILVNANKGIAVGVGSYVPNYPLKNACLATAAFIRGGKSQDEIIEILGAPDFPIRCTIHSDKDLLKKLFTTGSATFQLTGGFHRQGNDLVIDSVPAGVSFERVIEQIKVIAQTPEGKNEIFDVISNIGLDSTGILIKCKKGIPLKNLMIKLLQQTDIRSTVSFKTRIILDEVPVELSVEELIEKWVEFRSTCVKNVYTTRATKLAAREHKLSTWEKIYNNIKEVVADIMQLTEDEARAKFKAQYSLDDEQLDYLFDLKIKTICKDKAEKELETLRSVREDLRNTIIIRDDEAARNLKIAVELEEIARKYGTERVCVLDDLVPEEEKQKQARVIPDSLATVFITKRGLVKCLHKFATDSDIEKYMSTDDGLVVPPIYCKQSDYLLIYTYSGCCYKVLVDDIDSSRTDFKQYCWEMLDRKDNSDIAYVCPAGDYDKSFIIVYGNGRGRNVLTRDAAGNRRCYKNQFLWGNNIYGDRDRIFVVPYDCFYMVTASGKVAFGDARFATGASSRLAFKVARTLTGDPIIGFLDASREDLKDVDVNRYCMGYSVKPREECLINAIKNMKQ